MTLGYTLFEKILNIEFKTPRTTKTIIIIKLIIISFLFISFKLSNPTAIMMLARNINANVHLFDTEPKPFIPSPTSGIKIIIVKIINI